MWRTKATPEDREAKAIAAAAQTHRVHGVDYDFSTDNLAGGIMAPVVWSGNNVRDARDSVDTTPPAAEYHQFDWQRNPAVPLPVLDNDDPPSQLAPLLQQHADGVFPHPLIDAGFWTCPIHHDPYMRYPEDPEAAAYQAAVLLYDAWWVHTVMTPLLRAIPVELRFQPELATSPQKLDAIDRVRGLKPKPHRAAPEQLLSGYANHAAPTRTCTFLHPDCDFFHCQRASPGREVPTLMEWMPVDRLSMPDLLYQLPLRQTAIPVISQHAVAALLGIEQAMADVVDRWRAAPTPRDGHESGMYKLADSYGTMDYRNTTRELFRDMLADRRMLSGQAVDGLIRLFIHPQLDAVRYTMAHGLNQWHEAYYRARTQPALRAAYPMGFAPPFLHATHFGMAKPVEPVLDQMDGPHYRSDGPHYRVWLGRVEPHFRDFFPITHPHQFQRIMECRLQGAKWCNNPGPADLFISRLAAEAMGNPLVDAGSTMDQIEACVTAIQDMKYQVDLRSRPPEAYLSRPPGRMLSSVLIIHADEVAAHEAFAREFFKAMMNGFDNFRDFVDFSWADVVTDTASGAWKFSPFTGLDRLTTILRSMRTIPVNSARFEHLDNDDLSFTAQLALFYAFHFQCRIIVLHPTTLAPSVGRVDLMWLDPDSNPVAHTHVHPDAPEWVLNWDFVKQRVARHAAVRQFARGAVMANPEADTAPELLALATRIRSFDFSPATRRAMPPGLHVAHPYRHQLATADDWAKLATRCEYLAANWGEWDEDKRSSMQERLAERFNRLSVHELCTSPGPGAFDFNDEAPLVSVDLCATHGHHEQKQSPAPLPAARPKRKDGEGDPDPGPRQRGRPSVVPQIAREGTTGDQRSAFDVSFDD